MRKNGYKHTQPENGKGERKRSIAAITTRSGSKEKRELYRGLSVERD